MKVKLDENLPTRLLDALRQRGHDVQTVPQERLTGRPDADVWAAARQEERFLITQDLDFSDRRRYAPGSHAGLLIACLRAPGALALAERVVAALHTTPLESMAGCFAVLTERKLRVRRN
jgi:hypothetical protein